MKWNTDDLPVFVAVSEAGGIRAAADRLNMPKSTVSRTLSRLEDGLDVRLFDRNTRQLRLTAEGEAFLVHAQQVLEQVHAASEAVAGMRHNPTGRLKVAMPMAFSREVIGGRLADFNRLYPDVVLEVTVTSQPIQLMREELDVALVVGPIEDSDLLSQTITDTPLIWVASSDYAHPIDFEDRLSVLKPHIKFCERRYLRRKLDVRSPTGKQFLDTSAAMSINDPVMLRDIVMQGGGVGLLPELYCRHMLRTGELVQLCPGIVPDARAQIIAISPTRRLQPQKARVFVDFIKQAVQHYEQNASTSAS